MGEPVSKAAVSSLRRRRVGRLALVALIAALAAGLLGRGAGAPPHAVAKKKKQQRPNVVVVLSDDQTAAEMEVMDEVNSEIGDHGVTFANSFVNWSVCCPSRATLLTGQYAHNHGVRGNSQPQGGFQAFDNSETLAVWLRRAGYRTIHIGKFLNGYGGSQSGATFIPPGWSEWYAATAGTIQSVYDYVMNENGSLIDYGEEPEDFKQDVFTARAVDVINRRAPQRKPFFMEVAYTADHAGGPNPNPQPPETECQGTAKPAPRHATAFQSEPLPQPPNFNEADVSDKPEAIQELPPLDASDIATITRNYRCRRAALLSVDEGVGQIMDALRASGELRNTLVIYTSDNGFFHGEHRVRGGKTRVYEPSIRVPYEMRGPGIPKGKTVRDLMINADTAPTILKATGAQPRLKIDGHSVQRIARHPSRQYGRALLHDTAGYKAVRTKRYKYVEHGSGEIEMYDLRNDPYELQSVHADPAYDRVRARLAKLLDRLRNCSGRECWRSPDVKLKLRPDKVRGGDCRPPKLTVRLRGGEKGVVEEAIFRGAGKKDRDGHKPFKFKLSRSRLEGTGRVKIKATIELIDGRRDNVLKKRTKICG